MSSPKQEKKLGWNLRTVLQQLQCVKHMLVARHGLITTNVYHSSMVQTSLKLLNSL
jgi:hypothetical protein